MNLRATGAVANHVSVRFDPQLRALKYSLAALLLTILPSTALGLYVQYYSKFSAWQFITVGICSLIFMLALLGIGLWEHLVHETRKTWGAQGGSGYDATTLTSVIFFFLFVVVAGYSFSVPVFAWDYLEHWADLSREVALCVLSKSNCEIALQSTRHTNAIVLFGVNGLLLERLTGGLIDYWALVAILTMWCVRSYLCYLRAPTVVSILAALAIFTLPLLENHFLITGYLEGILSALVVAGWVSIAAWVKTGDRFYVFTTACSVLAMLGLKNTGLLYASVTLAGFFAAAYGTLRAVKLLLLGLIATVLAVNSGLIGLDLIGNKIDWSLSEKKLWIAGKELAYSGVSFASAVYNVALASVLNSSFGILFLGSFIVFVSSFDRGFRGNGVAPQMFALVLFSLLLVLLQFSRYGFRISVSGDQTGLSRLLLPMAPVSLMLIVESTWGRNEMLTVKE